MPITRLVLKKFTAFEKLDLKLSPGINVLIGENGTGKTHIMKAAYAAVDVSSHPERNFADKLVSVFLPSGHNPGSLVKQGKGSSACMVEIQRGALHLRASFTNRTDRYEKVKVSGDQAWREEPENGVFIPAKEILSNAPGFSAQYHLSRLNFEEVYQDIIYRALDRTSESRLAPERKRLLEQIQGILTGKVYVNYDKDEFHLKNDRTDLEFTLLAEGMRKLGLIWLLIQNDTLRPGTILFWDEPEANLNPKMYGPVVQILLDLQRMGVQIFLATHDWVILKEIDLRKQKENEVMFHALYSKAGATKQGEIECNSTDDFLQIQPNAILDTFVDLNDREIMRDWLA